MKLGAGRGGWWAGYWVLVSADPSVHTKNMLPLGDPLGSLRLCTVEKLKGTRCASAQAPICSIQHLLMCCRTSSLEQWLDLSPNSFHTPKNMELSPFNESSVAITCATKMRLSPRELLLHFRV